MQFTGSPPRVRGTVALYARGRCKGGITPACAGNRFETETPGHRGRDHPRVCGEQKRVSSGSGGWLGSPPRVRGTVSPFLIWRARPGITPACAGNRIHL